MTTHAEEFQALSDTLYHWSVYAPDVKCEIGCTALKAGSGWVVIDPVPLSLRGALLEAGAVTGGVFLFMP